MIPKGRVPTASVQQARVGRKKNARRWLAWQVDAQVKVIMAAVPKENGDQVPSSTPACPTPAPAFPGARRVFVDGLIGSGIGLESPDATKVCACGSTFIP
jgi:hypothetical protein